MRTMPNDAAQVRALAQLLSYFGWTWVGLIGHESDYARFAIELFLQVSVQYGVCVQPTHTCTLSIKMSRLWMSFWMLFRYVTSHLILDLT